MLQGVRFLRARFEPGRTTTLVLPVAFIIIGTTSSGVERRGEEGGQSLEVGVMKCSGLRTAVEAGRGRKGGGVAGAGCVSAMRGFPKRVNMVTLIYYR